MVNALRQFGLNELEHSAVVLVYSNAPDLALARQIAQVLVKEHLAACAHIGAQGNSIYEWNGQLEDAQEIPLSFKTVVAQIPALYDRLRQLHPYEVPEFLVLAVPGGSPEYRDWVRGQAAG